MITKRKVSKDVKVVPSVSFGSDQKLLKAKVRMPTVKKKKSD